MYRCIGLLVMVLPAVFAADPAYESAEAKLERLSNQEFKPGEVVTFNLREIDAWIHVAVPQIVPEGIRNPRVELGMDSANAYALVDFLKIRDAGGKTTNSLLASMLEGEHPLKVSVRVTSGGGRCTVYVTRVELSGAVLEGSVLDFLIKTFFLPLYPDAKINQPFDLDDNVERFDIRPEGIRVTIKK